MEFCGDETWFPYVIIVSKTHPCKNDSLNHQLLVQIEKRQPFTKIGQGFTTGIRNIIN